MWYRTAVVCLCLAAANACGQNLLSNPGAEQPSASQTPPGWGIYIGSGTARLSLTADEHHSGHSSACMELTGWHLPIDSADTPENRSVSAAIILAENDGYIAKGALPGQPGTTYTLSFWYKGDLRSASLSVTGWPAPHTDHTKRITMPVAAPPLRPNATWQRCVGTFQITEPARHFAVMIHAAGRQSEGFRLGKLYVDDAEITSRTYPDGQIRAIWCGMPKATNREQGRKEIAANLDKLKACGLNTLLVWTESPYIAAISRADLRQTEPRAAWDALGEVIRAARARGLQVHAWYSPWIYKDKSRAVELREHPEWIAVNAKGVADPDGVCLARPEVRRFELELLGSLIDRYPDLAGIHIEEPGYNWGQYCYCDHCKRLCREWYDLDITTETAVVRPILEHLAASTSTDFMIRLRHMLLQKRPQAWLSANGSGGANADGDRRIGRDWVTWARLGYIDFYVPQVYTKNVDDFLQGAMTTREMLGKCDMITGMAVSWSGVYPERQSPSVMQEQIRSAEKLGAKGFAVFHLDHFQEEHFRAIRDVIHGTATQPR